MSKYVNLYKSKGGNCLVSDYLSLDAINELYQDKIQIIILKNKNRIREDEAELFLCINGDRNENVSNNVSKRRNRP